MDKENVVHIYNGMLLSQDKIMSSAVIWLDLEIIILSEVRDRKTNIKRYHLYVESKKAGGQMNLLRKQKF